MKKLFYCSIYMTALGVLSFIVGRLLPKHWFHGDRFPFRTHPWEKRVYRALRVGVWQSKVPDMSRIFYRIMPRKRLSAENLAHLPRMIQKTCVAEAIHAALCIPGLAMLWIWPGAGGISLTIAYILLGNLPFWIVQRYNRPRLMTLYAMQQRKQERSPN